VNYKLHIWRQKNSQTKGKMVMYEAKDISPDTSFLEMLDIVNEDLVKKNEEPIAFDHDCREGICGMCSLVINGTAHGPDSGTTTCQLYMRKFKDGDSIYIEPFRAKAFPVIRDLVVDRTSFDHIIQAGGYVSVNTGGVPDGNALPISKVNAEIAMDAAACIGCGACLSVCPENWEMIERNGEFKAKPKKLDIIEDEYNSNSEAATICPVECIHIEKIKIKKRSAEELSYGEDEEELDSE